MVRVREYLHVVVVDICQVQLVKQHQSILEMNIIIGNAVHDQEPNIMAQGLYVADGGILIAGGVVLGCVHIALCVDRVCGKQKIG
jgi:hypothetical protein